MAEVERSISNEEFIKTPLDVTRFVTVDNTTIATILVVRSLEKFPIRDMERFIAQIIDQPLPKELGKVYVFFGDYDLDFYQIRENNNNGKT